ncbi:hypothetical protein RA876_07615 [Rhodoferax antarcticus]|nr:hypothetical protein RA876_07615 [Rhodoferax antarcticus]
MVRWSVKGCGLRQIRDGHGSIVQLAGQLTDEQADLASRVNVGPIDLLAQHALKSLQAESPRSFAAMLTNSVKA